jgi:hypothetical protein
MGGDLYHSVEAWEAIPCPPDVANARITPGRISTVFFCPEKTARALEDKPPGWASQRGGGFLPNPDFRTIAQIKGKERKSSRRSTSESDQNWARSGCSKQKFCKTEKNGPRLMFRKWL